MQLPVSAFYSVYASLSLCSSHLSPSLCCLAISPSLSLSVSVTLMLISQRRVGNFLKKPHLNGFLCGCKQKLHSHTCLRRTLNMCVYMCVYVWVSPATTKKYGSSNKNPRRVPSFVGLLLLSYCFFSSACLLLFSFSPKELQFATVVVADAAAAVGVIFVLFFVVVLSERNTCAIMQLIFLLFFCSIVLESRFELSFSDYGSPQSQLGSFTCRLTNWLTWLGQARPNQLHRLEVRPGVPN